MGVHATSLTLLKSGEANGVALGGRRRVRLDGMKRIMAGIRGLLGLVVLGTGMGAAEPQLIAEWDFNEPNRWEASQGNGRVSLVGGVLGTNFTGSANDPGKPNGALSLRAFPIQGTASRTASISQ